MTDGPAIQLGHVGIFVRDFELMLGFYTRVFGFIVTDGAEPPHNRVAFLSGDPDTHHQLVLVDSKSRHDDSVIQQISFRLPSLAAVRRLNAALLAEKVSEMRPLTHGTAWSIYFRDPENNRVEVFADTEWYITQPFVSPVDYSKPEEQIYRETFELCRSSPGFRMLRDWKAETDARMRAAMEKRDPTAGGVGSQAQA